MTTPLRPGWSPTSQRPANGVRSAWGVVHGRPVGRTEQLVGRRRTPILDDLHEIAESPAERALQRFVTLEAPTDAADPGIPSSALINIPRLRLSGPFHEIGSEELRFRSWEVEDLFAAVYREPLRPEAVAALTRRTRGWAAGLQLFHLATAGRSAAERHQAVTDLGGRSKLIRSYLTRNVLAELPDDRRMFLLRTCTLGRLSGLACDALLNTAGSHRILEELEGAQLFTSTDDDGLHFRYHEILQNYLEMALTEEVGRDGARSWYARSAVVLESLGELRSAARAFAKAEDWQAVSSLIRRAAPTGSITTCCPRAPADAIPGWRWPTRARLRHVTVPSAKQMNPTDSPKLLRRTTGDQICTAEREVVRTWLPGAASGDNQVHRHWSHALRVGLRVAPEFTVLSPTVGHAGMRLAYGLAAVVAGEIDWAREAIASVRRDESVGPLWLSF